MVSISWVLCFRWPARLWKHSMRAGCACSCFAFLFQRRWFDVAAVSGTVLKRSAMRWYQLSMCYWRKSGMALILEYEDRKLRCSALSPLLCLRLTRITRVFCIDHFRSKCVELKWNVTFALIVWIRLVFVCVCSRSFFCWFGMRTEILHARRR